MLRRRRTKSTISLEKIARIAENGLRSVRLSKSEKLDLARSGMNEIYAIKDGLKGETPQIEERIIDAVLDRHFLDRKTGSYPVPVVQPSSEPSLPAAAAVESAATSTTSIQKDAAVAPKNHAFGVSAAAAGGGKPQLWQAGPASLLESLQEKYGTPEILVIMEKELKARKFQNVLTLFDMLQNDQSHSTQAQIFKLRALQKTGKEGMLAKFLESATVNDGEIVLEKAKLNFRNRNYDECKRMLSKSLNLPHAFIDYDALKQEVYYYTARCATAQFDATPADQTYKEALDSWWQLRTALRANPDHEYNKKAISELQRMAKKMQKE